MHRSQIIFKEIFKLLALFVCVGCSTNTPLVPTVDAQEKAQLVDEKPITSFEECVAAGNRILRSYPAKCMTKDRLIFIQKLAPLSQCVDSCGNGTCEEIVCQAEGCPCAESAASCASDCKREE